MSEEKDGVVEQCAYDLCKKDSGLKVCEYCKQSFCKDHLPAKVPLLSDMPNMSDKEKKVWDRPGGHLCEEYKTYVTALEDEEFVKEADEEEVGHHNSLNCTKCHKELAISYSCEACGKIFCYDHRFPEKHACKHLKPIHSINSPKVHTGPIKLTIAFLSLFFLLALAYLSAHPEFFEEEVVLEEWVNFTDSIPEPVSFFEYSHNLSAFKGQTIVLKGFLYRSSSGSGVGLIKNYLFDEENNSVELAVINANHRSFFPSSGMSTDIFLVSGLVEEDMVGNLRLVVKTMVKSERDFLEFPSKQLMNSTIVIQKEGLFIDVFRFFTYNIRELFY